VLQRAIDVVVPDATGWAAAAVAAAAAPPPYPRRVKSCKGLAKSPPIQWRELTVQPFFQKSRTPTVVKEFRISLYDPAVADLEHFRNTLSAGFFVERL